MDEVNEGRRRKKRRKIEVCLEERFEEEDLIQEVQVMSISLWEEEEEEEEEEVEEEKEEVVEVVMRKRWKGREIGRRIELVENE